MLRNYLTIAFRNIQRRISYTVINVAGLSLGLAGALLIFSLITHHLSFDSFHADTDRIYRFVTEQHRDDVSYRPNVPNPFGKVFRDDYTFGEKVARIFTLRDVLLTAGQGSATRKFQDEIAFTEPEFFEIFNYPLIQGNSKTLLSEPNTAIITETMARKYFGIENVIDQIFRLDNRVDFKITGILKDFPGNTDRHTGIYLSYNSLKQFDPQYADETFWGGMSGFMQCFVKLKPGISSAEIEAVLPAYVKKYRPTNKNVHHYKLQPLSEMHFDARYGGSMEKTNLWVLSIIGIFLIATACINFINLATALAVQRSKEVGVRKVLGSARKQLFWQFIFETGVITFMATAMALTLATAALPYINMWFGTEIRFELLSVSQLALFLPSITIVVTLLSGFYPGLILSGFKPVVALKGKLLQQTAGGFNVRRSLIVTQFAISQVLTIGLIVIIYQIRFIQQSGLGFNKDAIVMIPLGSEDTRSTTVKNQFVTTPGVDHVSVCFSAPASENNWNTSLRFDNRSEEEDFGISFRGGDDQYLATFDIKLVAGRNLQPSDTTREFLVNETFVKKLNLASAEDILGRTISVGGGEWKGPVVGVVRDFHDRSFHEEINPVFISRGAANHANYYGVKISLRDAQATLGALSKTWSAMYPDQVFSYSFLNDDIAAFYQTEATMLKLIQLFAGISIFIGCIGLYGLVSFMATQKTKEIGIRKVLGSSIPQILWIFGKEFSALIIIAFAIAAPIGTWAMHGWLENFKYKIDLGLWVYALAISATALVALATVCYRSFRAAMANPVNSLRSE